jgi:transcriptional regulator with XRE-family HTH domain
MQSISEESKKLGQNLKRIRMKKGISQNAIAKTLDIDRSFITNIEGGKTNPTLATIAKLAKAIGVSVGELMK